MIGVAFEPAQKPENIGPRQQHLPTWVTTRMGTKINSDCVGIVVRADSAVRCPDRNKLRSMRLCMRPRSISKYGKSISCRLEHLFGTFMFGKGWLEEACMNARQACCAQGKKNVRQHLGTSIYMPSMWIPRRRIFRFFFFFSACCMPAGREL